MFSELRNERRLRIGARAAADRKSAAGIGDNSAEVGDGAAGIVDIATNVIPCYTSSWMETGVTLFLEEKFQRGQQWTIEPVNLAACSWHCSDVKATVDGHRLTANVPSLQFHVHDTRTEILIHSNSAS